MSGEMNAVNGNAANPAAVQVPPAEARKQVPPTNRVAEVNIAEKAAMKTEDLRAVVDKLNELMADGKRSLNFQVDSGSDSVVVQVMDSQTQELVRQIPTEEALKLREFIEGMMGIIFNRKV